jgi:outer membrane protein assembly factor BamB
LQAVAIECQSGKVLWHREVFVEDSSKAPMPHAKNTHASPTPATDGRRLYVHFGHLGTAALDFDGKVLLTGRSSGRMRRSHTSRCTATAGRQSSWATS